MNINPLTDKNITSRNTISGYKRRGRDILYKLKFSNITSFVVHPLSFKEIKILDRLDNEYIIRM